MFLSIGTAFSLLCGQVSALSTILNDAGKHTIISFGDTKVEITSPNQGFYSDSTNTTAMFTLLAAIGNAKGETSNTILEGSENTESFLIDATDDFDNFWVSSAAIYSAVKGASVVIQVKDSVNIISNDIGVLGQSNTQEATRPDNAASISIKGKNISITAGNMDGSYDNNAFSVGGNIGYRFTFAEQAFVEPMFGLKYAYMTGDDYKASSGIKV